MSGLLNKLQSLYNNSGGRDLFMVNEYLPEEEAFLLDDAYIGCTCLCTPLIGSNSEIQNGLTELFRKDFPTDSFLDFHLFASPDIEQFLQQFETVRGHRSEGDIGSMRDDISRANYGFWDKGRDQPIHGSGLKARNFDLYISFKMPLKKYRPTNTEMKEFRRHKNVLVSALASLGMAPILMDDDMLLRKMQTMVNWGKDSSWRGKIQGVRRNVPLRDQVIDIGGAISIEKDHIKLNNKIAHVLSVQKYPDFVDFGAMFELVCDWRTGADGIRDNFAITYSVNFPEKQKAINSFIKDRTFLTHQSHGPIMKFFDTLKYQKADFDQMYDSVERKKERILKAAIYWTVYSDDVESANMNVTAAKSYLAKKKWALVEDKYFVGPLFMNSFPMNSGKGCMEKSARYDTFTSDNAAFLAPVLASWKGNAHGRGKAVVPLITRDGQIFNFDLFESNGNYNGLTCAGSGSGKSFWNNYLSEMLLSSGLKKGGTLDPDNGNAPQHKDGGIVYIVDVGYSYQNLCEAHGGQYVDFDENMKFSLNPFKTVDEFKGADGQGDMLLQLLCTMASEKGIIDDFQKSSMSTILGKMWDDLGKNSTITEFANRCLNHQDQRVIDIGVQLEPFTESGIYGEYFSDEYPPIKFEKDFIVVELETLKSRKHLQIVVLMIVISQIQYSMYLTGTDRNKVFLMDEAWEFLAEGGSFIGKFLETGWRRFRKYQAAGIAITQSLADAYKTPAGVAIANNSNHKIMLRQEPEDIENLKKNKMFEGTDADYLLMKSVKTVKGEYSELYIRSGPAAEVCRLFVPRYQQLQYSTDGKDKSRIAKYVQQGYNRGAAIEKVVQDELNGIRD